MKLFSILPIVFLVCAVVLPFSVLGGGEVEREAGSRERGGEVSLQGEEVGEGTVRRAIMETIFSGSETMHFSVSWTGGIKIGDLSLDLGSDGDDDFAIRARVTGYGLFRRVYPVDDEFTTYVRGATKLPYRYEVHQREGRRETRRQTLYDQQGLLVNYRKNEMEEEVFSIAGPVHNEFSSFYITRVMKLVPDGSFIVPTFADKKRNEVRVLVRGREDIDTVFGRVRTVVVLPQMKFKGLYDKTGDTVIWLTDDECRVPVRINSKILIGSLTAELTTYANPACERY